MVLAAGKSVILAADVDKLVVSEPFSSCEWLRLDSTDERHLPATDLDALGERCQHDDRPNDATNRDFREAPMSDAIPLAHSKNVAGEPHELKTHLNDVAEDAVVFAAKLGSGEWGRAAGLWHDLGKNAPDFQAKLDPDAHIETIPGRVDHSSAGAVYAVDQFGRGLGLPVAFTIAGHHSGLPDLDGASPPGLNQRLSDPAKRDRLQLALSAPGSVIPRSDRPPLPAFLAGIKGDPAGKRRYEFWVRMLFSCLVDADFLDTERHFDAGRADARGRPRSGIEMLLTRLRGHIDGLAKRPGRVNDVRARILADCVAKGSHCDPGVFRLTAPTGAGKTLAGMRFALEHALARGKDRVIVVVPFTSIIDQNADVYSKVFGEDNVIQHHASLDPATETWRNRTACENWDAPVVVTTSVQFVESLFANKPSRCRKLHNVCNSVVVFDEVQTLPIPHLLPIVDVLKELVAHYGVTLALSTATQPALGLRGTAGGFTFPGFEHITEIVSDVPGAFADLRRVNVHLPPADADPVTWEALAGELVNRDEVLAIVHRRDDARDLVREMDQRAEGTLHLSALMCPAHRLKVIGTIKNRLEANRILRDWGKPIIPVRVVSTQLVEAGADFDFPVLYRAFGGFDSIAQAAGRCNREGRLERGEVQVFKAPTAPPRGTPKKAADIAGTMLSDDPCLDPLDPGIYDRYFRQVYDTHEIDPKRIQADRADWKFRSVAEAFRMIEDDGQVPVAVPYIDDKHNALARVAALEAAEPGSARRRALRAVQPFVVTVTRPQFERLRGAGCLREVAEVVWAVTDPTMYDERLGLLVGGTSPDI